MLKRRGFLGGLLAAPLIVRPGLLMPVKAYDLHRQTIGDRSLCAIADEAAFTTDNLVVKTTVFGVFVAYDRFWYVDDDGRWVEGKPMHGISDT